MRAAMIFVGLAACAQTACSGPTPRTISKAQVESVNADRADIECVTTLFGADNINKPDIKAAVSYYAGRVEARHPGTDWGGLVAAKVRPTLGTAVNSTSDDCLYRWADSYSKNLSLVARKLNRNLY
jgi:hypothetical protein